MGERLQRITDLLDSNVEAISSLELPIVTYLSTVSGTQGFITGNEKQMIGGGTAFICSLLAYIIAHSFPAKER